MKFIVFSDLHYDETEDGNKRIEDILENAKKRDLDFIVSLGDLCSPLESNRKVIDKFNSLGVPFYNVIGNHETDDCTFEEITRFFSMEKPYYSKIIGDFKLIFLNTCYLSKNWVEEEFCSRNFKNTNSIYPIIPREEVKWLEEELSDKMKYIIFSHHSLSNEFAKRGVSNRKQIQSIFEKSSVLLCLNGHDHGDDLTVINDVPYFTVNSANYVWLGSQIDSSEEFRRKYAYLQGLVQYKNAMSAYVEIDDEKINITGMDSEYLSLTPSDINLHDYRWNGVSIKPLISSYTLKIK